MKINSSRISGYLSRYSNTILIAIICIIGYWSGFFSQALGVVVAFCFYLSPDLLKKYTLIKTPKEIRMLSSLSVLFTVYLINDLINDPKILGECTILIAIFVIVIVGLFYIYMGGKKLVEEIDKNNGWNNNSYVSRRYNRDRDRLKRDTPDLLFRYYVSWWGNKIGKAEEFIKFLTTVDSCTIVFLLYTTAAGLISLLALANKFVHVQNEIFSFAALLSLVGMSFIDVPSRKVDNKSESAKVLGLDLIRVLKEEKGLPLYIPILVIGILFAFIIMAIMIYILIIGGIAGEKPLHPSPFGLLTIPFLISWFVIMGNLIWVLTLQTKSVISRCIHNKNLKIARGSEIILIVSILCALLQLYLLGNLNHGYYNAISFLTLPFIVLIIFNHLHSKKKELTKYREITIWSSAVIWIIGSTVIIGSSLIYELLYNFIVLSLALVFFRVILIKLEKVEIINLQELFKLLLLIIPIYFLCLWSFDLSVSSRWFLHVVLIVLTLFAICLAAEITKVRGVSNIYEIKFKKLPISWFYYRIFGYYGLFTKSEVKKYFPILYKRI